MHLESQVCSLEQAKKLKRPVFEFPNYSIDVCGNVFGYWGRKLKPQKNRQGYDQVHLYDKGRHKLKRVHRIVLETFIGECPPGMQACHNNGNKTDNRLENLRWDTAKANQNDKKLHGTYLRGERHSQAKLNPLKIRVAVHLRRIGWPCFKIAELYSVTTTAISQATLGKTWAQNEKRQFYSKMNPLKVRVAVHLKSFGWREAKIAKLFGVSNSTIGMATRGVTWGTISSSNSIRKV